MFSHATSSVNLKIPPLDAPLSSPRATCTMFIILNVARCNTIAIGEREDEKTRPTELVVLTKHPVRDSTFALTVSLDFFV
jgi:hypothetical protein